MLSYFLWKDIISEINKTKTFYFDVKTYFLALI